MTRELLTRLTDRYDVHQFELHDDLGTAAVDRPWVVHRRTDEGDPLGLRTIPRLLGALHPDLLLIVADAWLCGTYRRVVPPNRGSTRTIAYVAIEGPDMLLPAATFDWLDCLVVYHEAARAMLRRAVPRLPRLAVVGHGVDADSFAPLAGSISSPDRTASRQKARAILFPERPEIRRGFVTLNANRNTGRKRVDLTLEGFAVFARAHPDAWLYLHMGMRDRGCDVRAEARRLGIADRLLVTHDRDEMPRVSDACLRTIYNACDVGVNTSAGEGWGLVAFEHAATCAAQLLPSHPTCRELWEGAATLLPVTPQPPRPHEFFRAATVTPDDLAAALARLYDEREALETESLRALQRATDPNYSWDAITDRWHALFTDLLCAERNTVQGVRPAC